MSTQNNKKLSIKNLFGLVGIASASVLLSVPVLAQSAPTNNSGATMEQQMNNQRTPADDRQMPSNSSNTDQQMNNGSSTTEIQQYNRRSTTSSQQVNTDTPATTTQPYNTDTSTPGSQQTPISSPGTTGTPQINNSSTTNTITGTTQESAEQGVRALW